MKRFLTVLSVATMMIVFGAATCFAADFHIESTYPETGATNTTKENMCVKVTFSQEVGNAASKKANADKVKITDPDGAEVPTVIYYNKKDPKYALVHIDTTKVPQSGDGAIKDDTTYTCTIFKDFRDNEGDTLGSDTVVEFTTMNQGRGMMIYMILMIGFMVAMVFFSVLQSKKQMEEGADDANPDEPFNPYKEAKRTGKSVEQVIAEHDKKENKTGLAALLGGSTSDKQEDSNEPELPEGHYRVKRPRPISEAGSTYKTGRKAKAEEAAKKAAEAKAKRKEQGYSKKKSANKDTSKAKSKGKGKKKK